MVRDKLKGLKILGRVTSVRVRVPPPALKLSYRNRVCSLTEETSGRTLASRFATLFWLLRLAGRPSARRVRRQRCGRRRPLSSCAAVHGPKSARERLQIPCPRGSRRVRIATLAGHF